MSLQDNLHVQQEILTMAKGYIPTGMEDNLLDHDVEPPPSHTKSIDVYRYASLGKPLSSFSRPLRTPIWGYTQQPKRLVKRSLVNLHTESKTLQHLNQSDVVQDILHHMRYKSKAQS